RFPDAVQPPSLGQQLLGSLRKMGRKRLLVEKANELILSWLNLQLISRTDFVETWRPFLHSNSHAEAHATTPSGPPFLKHYRGRLVRSPQKPADVAVVMLPILR